jgi:hypothetical protein
MFRTQSYGTQRIGMVTCSFSARMADAVSRDGFSAAWPPALRGSWIRRFCLRVAAKQRRISRNMTAGAASTAPSFALTAGLCSASRAQIADAAFPLAKGRRRGAHAIVTDRHRATPGRRRAPRVRAQSPRRGLPQTRRKKKRACDPSLPCIPSPSVRTISRLRVLFSTYATGRMTRRRTARHARSADRQTLLVGRRPFRKAQ